MKRITTGHIVYLREKFCLNTKHFPNEMIKEVYDILDMLHKVRSASKQMRSAIRSKKYKEGDKHRVELVNELTAVLRGFEENRKNLIITEQQKEILQNIAKKGGKRHREAIEHILSDTHVGSSIAAKDDIYRRGRRLRGAGFSRQ